MKIKALVPFSNGTLSMEQYQVAEVTDTLGNQLIAAGVAIEIGGGGSGGGVIVVTPTPSDNAMVLDKTWQEIKDADAVSVVFDRTEEARAFLFCSDVFERVPLVGGSTEFCVTILRISNDGVSNFAIFVASSASGYPSATVE